MASEAQNRANREYRKRCKAAGTMKRITLDFYPTELDLYEHICGQESKAGYIKRLVREDMEG